MVKSNLETQENIVTMLKSMVEASLNTTLGTVNTVINKEMQAVTSILTIHISFL